MDNQSDIPLGTLPPRKSRSKLALYYNRLFVAKNMKDLDPETWQRIEAAGQREITEQECAGQLGFDFSTTKKWWILTVVFLLQMLMNFNTSIYSNAVHGIAHKFGRPDQEARAGVVVFLITYAFGCVLWAPVAEKIGRKPALSASLGIVHLWSLLVLWAPNLGSVLVGRALGGLFTAGSSVALGVVEDLYRPYYRQFALAFIVLASVLGPILGSIVGGFVQQYSGWKMCLELQIFMGTPIHILHFFAVPETRTTIMMDNIAKTRRLAGQDPSVYGPNEFKSPVKKDAIKELLCMWVRPLNMLFTDIIVLMLTLASAFSNTLIYIFIQTLPITYKKWGFSPSQSSLAFLPLGIGYLFGWVIFMPVLKRNMMMRGMKPDDEQVPYELRLEMAVSICLGLPFGVSCFAWVAMETYSHWVLNVVTLLIIGVVNYAIQMASIDYLTAAYAPYSASVLSAHEWVRYLMAAGLTMAAVPGFTLSPIYNDATGIFVGALGLIMLATFTVVMLYIVYVKGRSLRKRSRFARGSKVVDEYPGLVVHDILRR